MVSNDEFLCQECAPNVIEDEIIGNSTGKKGRYYERMDKDDEEEWGRIPIPQSDDSYSTEDWFSDETKVEEDDHNQGNYYQGILTLQSNALAYMVGPRKDGRILTKAGTIIDLNVPTVNNPVRQADRITD
jgi:hypothetical protein